MGLLLLLGAALSLDALGIGVSYGMRGIKLGAKAQIVIFVLTFVYTAAAAFAGTRLLAVVPAEIANAAGIVLLFAMGAFVLLSALRKERPKKSPPCEEHTILDMAIKRFGLTIRIIKNPVMCDLDASNSISGWEAAYLVLVLCLDSIGAVVGTALTGIGVGLLPVFTALFQIGFLNAGHLLGRRLCASRWADSKCAMVLPGVILMGIGVSRLLGAIW